MTKKRRATDTEFADALVTVFGAKYASRQEFFDGLVDELTIVPGEPPTRVSVTNRLNRTVKFMKESQGVDLQGRIPKSRRSSESKIDAFAVLIPFAKSNGQAEAGAKIQK